MLTDLMLHVVDASPGEQLHVSLQPRLILEINASERLAPAILHDEARVVVLLDRPWRREAAGLHYAAGPWVGSCASCTSSSLGRHCRNARSAASLRAKRWRPPQDEQQSSRGSDAPETAPTWRQEGQMIEMSMPLSYHVCRAPAQRLLLALLRQEARRCAFAARGITGCVHAGTSSPRTLII